ncbi:MAG: M20/M25/M40 family metallo-hydrolase [Muribaculaceae bacterium]|nr:M20/M25/M40 family metallo-hydrolase [Muribaculaceae bacterium]
MNKSFSSLLFRESIGLLQNLISVPSFSNQEDQAAELWEYWLKGKGIVNVKRFHNNVYALSEDFDPKKPTLLLNSHLDTVKPVDSYTRDPFKAEIIGDRLFGLGSNDAGASGISLAATFIEFYKRKNLNFNILLAITASEERMGELGMRAFLPFLRNEGIYPDMAIVGEPTGMEAAIGERGLVVIDATVAGKAGHAARDEGENAIYKAIEDIQSLRKLDFPKKSDVLGPLKLNVTMISAGTQHNVIPDCCNYVIDVRTTDAYSNEKTVEIIKNAVRFSKIQPRSTRIHPSVIDEAHILVKAAELSGLKTFISTTTSDMALMYDIPSIKLGPGKSERSHTADEFILLSEIEEAMKIYPVLLRNLDNLLKKN